MLPKYTSVGYMDFIPFVKFYIPLGCALRNTYNCTHCTNPNTLYRNLLLTCSPFCGLVCSCSYLNVHV